MADQEKASGTGFRINAIGEIIDTDPFIIECCDYSEIELTDLFNKCVGYHDSLAEANSELQKLDTKVSFTVPGGSYASTAQNTYNSHAARAMKITQRMTHIENRLNRVAESVRLRAQLKHS